MEGFCGHVLMARLRATVGWVSRPVCAQLMLVDSLGGASCLYCRFNRCFRFDWCLLNSDRIPLRHISRRVAGVEQ